MRCWTGLNLNWFKSYDKNAKKRKNAKNITHTSYRSFFTKLKKNGKRKYLSTFCVITFEPFGKDIHVVGEKTVGKPAFISRKFWVSGSNCLVHIVQKLIVISYLWFTIKSMINTTHYPEFEIAQPLRLEPFSVLFSSGVHKEALRFWYKLWHSVHMCSSGCKKILQMKNKLLCTISAKRRNKNVKECNWVDVNLQLQKNK